MNPPLFPRSVLRLLAAACLLGPARGAEPVMEAPIRTFMEQQCFDCHADGVKKGGVAFDEHGSEAALLADKPLWLRVLKNVRAGLMPPPERPSPPAPEARAALQQWIYSGVFQLDPARPDPGRPVLRRLNRTEYRNTVQDLTGVDFRVDEEFPADDAGHGFDNIGEVLNVSPLLLEKYLAAAREIVRQAVPPAPRIRPEQHTGSEHFHRHRPGEPEGPQTAILPFTEPAAVTATARVAHPGSYRVTFQLTGRERYVEGEFDINRARLIFLIDGVERGRLETGAAGGRDFRREFTCDFTPGPHAFTVALERLTPDARSVRDLGVEVRGVTLSGPDAAEFWTKAEGYSRWFPREVPPEAGARLAYAREILGGFARRAFRRPVETDYTERLAGLARTVWQQPGQSFESGISRAMEAILASPRFLFREEFTVPAAEGQFPFVDDHTLASRLSYFLWSTMPDGELMRAADQQVLRAELGSQIQRMLAHDKARALVRNFTGQWLQARDVEGIPIDGRTVLLRQARPDPEVEAARARFFELRRKEATELNPEEKADMAHALEMFRKSRERFKDADFSGALRRDMRRETERYFEYILREDRPLTELIESDYTFLNQRLAAHYGIPGVEGDDFRRVTLPGGHPRGGILTQGTVLAVTSNPTRTSPVKRGLFILEKVLGTPPPPPPPNIPPLEDLSKGRGFEGTLRENLARHRADPKCASCHNRMDPLGLAFENFNAMGLWRDEERGVKVESGGRLISGESFTGIQELKHLLVTSHRAAFYRCFTEKMLLYALGRGLEWQDETTLNQLTATLEQSGGKVSALISGIIHSDAFLRRRNGN